MRGGTQQQHQTHQTPTDNARGDEMFKLDCQQRKKQGGCISCQTAFYEYEESLTMWDKSFGAVHQ